MEIVANRGTRKVHTIILWSTRSCVSIRGQGHSLTSDPGLPYDQFQTSPTKQIRPIVIKFHVETPRLVEKSDSFSIKYLLPLEKKTPPYYL